jgi:hypothetical protein
MSCALDLLREQRSSEYKKLGVICPNFAPNADNPRRYLATRDGRTLLWPTPRYDDTR